MKRPLAIELFCGRFGWSRGWLSEGGWAVGFDIEHLPHHGEVPAGADLVLQDVKTLDGAQFKDASLILASPPCQEYSFMAMPWKRSKQIAAALRGQSDFPKGYRGSRTIADLNALFDACFRIQLEASKAKGEYIPMVVENVKGAQPWVGRAKAHYGSYYLWGDVEDMGGRIVARGPLQFGMPSVRAGRRSTKNDGGSWFAVAHNTESGHSRNPVNGTKVSGLNWSGSDKPGYVAKAFNTTAEQRMGVKQPGHSGRDPDVAGHFGSKSPARKAASAAIAEIPFELSSYIARVYLPVRNL